MPADASKIEDNSVVNSAIFKSTGKSEIVWKQFLDGTVTSGEQMAYLIILVLDIYTKIMFYLILYVINLITTT